MRSTLPILFAVLTAPGLTSGCTRPAVAPEAPALQKQAWALRDWQDVARQIATDMQRDGFLPSLTRPELPPPRVPYFIKVRTADSKFLHEVGESLKSEILARGGAVASTAYGAAEIDLDVDVVHWPARHRAPDAIGTEMGLASGTGVLLANAAPLTPAEGFGLLAGAGLVSDLLRTMTPTTDTEIAWGASITMGNRVVFEVRYPMYVGDHDDYLYHQEPPQIVQLRYAP